MMLEVRNGTVQIRKSTIWAVRPADLEGEDVGDGEAQDDGDGPDDDGVAKGVEVSAPGDGGTEHVGVVGELEGGDDLDAVVVEETDDDEGAHWEEEEDAEDGGQGAGLEEGDQISIAPQCHLAFCAVQRGKHAIGGQAGVEIAADYRTIGGDAGTFRCAAAVCKPLVAGP